MSPLKVGTADVVDVRVGTAEVKAIYVGSTLVWQRSVPQVSVLKVAASSLSNTNRTTHTYTYTLQSASQTGKVALLVCFAHDDGDEDVTISAPSGMTMFGRQTLSDPEGSFWCFYVPSAGEFSAGQVTFTFTTSSTEVGQIVVFELDGVDLADPVESFVVDASNASRSSMGGMSISVSRANSLLIANRVSATSAQYSITTTNAQGFTEAIGWPDASGRGYPSAYFYTRAAATAGSYTAPTFGVSPAGDVAALAFAVKPG